MTASAFQHPSFHSGTGPKNARIQHQTSSGIITFSHSGTGLSWLPDSHAFHTLYIHTQYIYDIEIGRWKY
jgi:hypothetical protein